MPKYAIVGQKYLKNVDRTDCEEIAAANTFLFFFFNILNYLCTFKWDLTFRAPRKNVVFKIIEIVLYDI